MPLNILAWDRRILNTNRAGPTPGFYVERPREGWDLAHTALNVTNGSVAQGLASALSWGALPFPVVGVGRGDGCSGGVITLRCHLSFLWHPAGGGVQLDRRGETPVSRLCGSARFQQCVLPIPTKTLALSTSKPRRATFNSPVVPFSGDLGLTVGFKGKDGRGGKLPILSKYLLPLCGDTFRSYGAFY